MTESTQLQTAENNNAGVVKMEPLPPAATTASTANTNLATSPAPSSVMEQQTQQQQTASIISATLQQQQQQLQQQQQQHQQQQQQYALKWNDYQTSMLSSFRHLRDEEDFVDVTLACDERSFTAHKVVLSACSPYFRKLLKANPCEHPIIILRDVPADDVENLLSFIYNGEVNVGHEHLSEFLKTAHLLQIRGLADVNNGAAPPFTSTLTSSTPVNKLNSSPMNSQFSGSANKLNFLTAATQALSNASNSPFTTPSLGSTTPLNNLLNNCGNISSSSNNNSNNNNTNNNNTGNNNNNNNNNNNSSSNNNNNNNNSNNNNSGKTPAIQELKASSASPANHWDLTDSDSNRNSHLTPPPQKRIKSADLFRAQHGISPERLLIDREFPVAGQHPLTRNRDRSRETSRDRDREREMRESLLGQALENSNGLQKQHPDMASLHAQSAGEDSNSSDTEPSDRGGDGQHDGTMDSMDNQRSHSFPNAFLGLQGIPGLLPGPSGMGANDFVTRRSLEMRVRATDPRPCPKCGKIYRSAHTLRTHLEDKHTVCPGYRCVLCGTVAKSRNSLHSHMSRQHRGISTKDLPVLPMPSAFDPELASRLLAKAGVKISAAELRARASPTNSSGTGQKIDINLAGNMKDEIEDSDDEPEDLTNSTGFMNNTGNNDLSRYHESLLSNFGHANTTISRIRNEAAAAAAVAALGQQKDLGAGQIPTSTAAGQSLLDTYLQFITENTFGMGMTQEHAAAAALHAAKMAQLNAMGHGLDKLPPGLLPPQFDLSKLAGTASAAAFPSAIAGNNSGLTIEPIMRREQSSTPNNENMSSVASNNTPASQNNNDLRRDPSEPMDLGLEGNNQSGSHNDNNGSDNDDNYSEDEGVHNT